MKNCHAFCIGGIIIAIRQDFEFLCGIVKEIKLLLFYSVSIDIFILEESTMNKQQLAAKIWESANRMRSKIEANEYKDYILGFIFYKAMSQQTVDK